MLGRRSRRLYAAGAILPPRVRDAATPLFAFFLSAVDEITRDGARPDAADDVRARVDRIFRGEGGAHFVDRALTRVVDGYGLRRAPFDLLLEGLQWDADGRRYATDGALVDYCVRVAATLAVATVQLMGRSRRVVLERACDLAIAIKLTCIARDVGRDAARGRLYLPIEWLEEAGADVDLFLEHPTASPGVRAAVSRVLQTADAYFRRADPGIAALPLSCRPAVRAVRYVYAAIGDEIEHAELDTVTRTVQVSLPRAARLAIRALRPSRSETRAIEQSRLDAVTRLVDAVV